jgi:nitrogen regulatory protein PII-like uncharacterized protein
MATAQEVIDSVRRLINDEAASSVSGSDCSDEELLDWITDAQREIVKLSPEAYTVTEIHAVTADLPRQMISTSSAYKLIRVEANGAEV